jgi:hypothetical protein
MGWITCPGKYLVKRRDAVKDAKKTKNNVIVKVITDRRRLEQNLDKLSPEEMVQNGVVGEWSVKDLLAHLAAWEELYMGWLAAAR